MKTDIAPTGKYKLVPENWKTVPEGRYRQAIYHIESVLLEISTDGNLSLNIADGKLTAPRLRRWADHLRTALKDLTKEA